MDRLFFLSFSLFLGVVIFSLPTTQANPIAFASSIASGLISAQIDRSITSSCSTYLDSTTAAKKSYIDSMSIGKRWVALYSPTLFNNGASSLTSTQSNSLNSMETVLAQATSSYQTACGCYISCLGQFQTAGNEAAQFSSLAAQVAKSFGFNTLPPGKRAVVPSLSTPCDWTCSAYKYGDGKACHCGCGAIDPDCANQALPIYGCFNLVNATCPAGICVPGTGSSVPKEWKCPHEFYNAADGCDCNCGAWDPDCADPTQTIFGCLPTQTCAQQTASCADSLIPNSWFCPLSAYGLGDGCDCNCGAPDPDCLVDSGVKRGSCPCPYMECSSHGICVGECSGYIVTETSQNKTRFIIDDSPLQLLTIHELQVSRIQSQPQRTMSTSTSIITERREEVVRVEERAITCTVPSNWLCPPGYYSAQDGCDCECGVWDPDCDEDGQLFVFGCDPAYKSTCIDSVNLGGVCSTISTTPVPGWICPNDFYNDTYFCDCGCGGWDPDCYDQELPIIGCAEGIKCEKSSATCDYRTVPPEWTCNPAYYLDSLCDCNCGASDPACNPSQKQDVLGCPCPEMTCFDGFCTGPCGVVDVFAKSLQSSSSVLKLRYMFPLLFFGLFVNCIFHVQ